jgi:hypothetical protein
MTHGVRMTPRRTGRSIGLPGEGAVRSMSLDHTLVISYLTLRKAVGFLGLMFPVILLVGGFITDGRIQDSISEYYYTPLRNPFVGLLFAIGLFFFSYNGYDRDRDAGLVACVCAIGVALCPARFGGWVTAMHYVFAGTLFSTLAYFSLCLFTRSDTKTPTARKEKRNLVYRVAGIVMIVCLLLIVVVKLTPLGAVLSPIKPVFVGEFILLWAFGASWAVKGEAILKDLPDEAPRPADPAAIA